VLGGAWIFLMNLGVVQWCWEEAGFVDWIWGLFNGVGRWLDFLIELEGCSMVLGRG
jgi:hypothetical protein